MKRRKSEIKMVRYDPEESKRLGAIDISDAISGPLTPRDHARCSHLLEKISVPGYRYRCVRCGRLLKIASGAIKRGVRHDH